MISSLTTGARPKDRDGLGDEGVDAGTFDPTPITTGGFVAEADQALRERAVFCSHSLMTRVTLVESPPLTCNLGKADFSLLKEKSSAGEACGNPCAKGWAGCKADAGVQGDDEAKAEKKN